MTDDGQTWVIMNGTMDAPSYMDCLEQVERSIEPLGLEVFGDAEVQVTGEFDPRGIFSPDRTRALGVLPVTWRWRVRDKRGSSKTQTDRIEGLLTDIHRQLYELGDHPEQPKPNPPASS